MFKKLILLILLISVGLITKAHAVLLFADDFNNYVTRWTPSVASDGAAFYPWTTDQTFNPNDPADNGGGVMISNYEPSAIPANLRTNGNSWNGWVQYQTSTGSVSIETAGGVNNSPAARFRLVKYTGLSNELGLHKWLGNTHHREVWLQYDIKFGSTGEDFWWNGSWTDGGPDDPGDLGIIWKLGRVWTGFNPTDYDKTLGQTQPVENTVWTDESNWRCGIWIWGVMGDIWNEAPNSLYFYLANFYWSPTCPDGGAGTCDSQNAQRLGPYFWDWKRYTTNQVPLSSPGRLNSFLNSGNPLDNNGTFSQAQDFARVKIRFKNRSTPATNDGAFQIWINNVEFTNDTNLNPAITPSMSTDPDDYGINFIRIGDNFNNLTRNIPDNPGYMDVWVDNVRMATTESDLSDSIIFESDFNSDNDWSVPYQWNAVVWPDAVPSNFPSSNPTTGARMIGYSGQDSVITGQTNPRIAIMSAAGKDGSGKGMRMRCEAIYGQNDQHSVWYSDTQTYYTLTNTPGAYGYPEIWIQMWRRYQPNFYSRAGNIKYMHVSHFRGGSLNDWHYTDEADVDHAPLAVLDTVTFDSDINCCGGGSAYDDLSQDFEPWAYTMFRLDPYTQRTTYNPSALYEGIFHHTYLGEVHATLNMTGGWRDPGNYGDANWHYHEVHLKMNTSPGATDGEYGYYIDSVPQLVVNNVPWIATGGTMVGWNMVSPGGNQDFHTLVPGGETFYYDIDNLVISTYRVGQSYVIGSTGSFETPTVTAGADFQTFNSSASISGTYTKDDTLTAIVSWQHAGGSGICVALLGSYTGTVTNLPMGSTNVTVTITDSENQTASDIVSITRSVASVNTINFIGVSRGSIIK